MRYIILLSLFFLNGCDSGSFNKDKRQIMAKNHVLSHLPSRSSNFNITSFREDTLHQSSDSVFKQPIVYTLAYNYTDSTGKPIVQKASVMFTPDGRSLINSSSQPQ